MVSIRKTAAAGIDYEKISLMKSTEDPAENNLQGLPVPSNSLKEQLFTI